MVMSIRLSMPTTGMLYSNFSTNLPSLYSLSVTAGTIAVKADITTYGPQVYNGNLLIGDNGTNGLTRVLLSEDPSIQINGNIDDTTLGTHNLVIKAITDTAGTPVITLNGVVGDIAPLASLTVTTGAQDRSVGTLVSDIMSTPSNYVGHINLLGNVSTVDDQIYTSNQIDIGAVQSPAAYTFTSKSGHVIFNTGVASSVASTLATGSSYHVIDIDPPVSTDATSAALVLAEIKRNTVAANDTNYQRRSGAGESESSLEIVCVNYDDNGNCRLDD